MDSIVEFFRVLADSVRFYDEATCFNLEGLVRAAVQELEVLTRSGT